jgi:uncharacterized flavoprotein (TIGR03862 family)
LNTVKKHKKVVIVGGGPAGMMAASQLQGLDCEVVIVDQKATTGRKFLVAGDGGFNLTHSEPANSFVLKYNDEWIQSCFKRYTNTDFIAFLDQLGIGTRIGSSGKIFPLESIKPVQVLNAWKAFLSPFVTFVLNAKVIDFESGKIQIEQNGAISDLMCDYLVFALGGASWPNTGSDGMWESMFQAKGIALDAFQSSNSGLELYPNWLEGIEGKIVKNIVLTCGNQRCSGDFVVTSYGIEGKPVYAVNGALRTMEKKYVFIDWKPQFSREKIIQVLRKAKNPSQGLKTLAIDSVALFWLKTFTSKEVYNHPEKLADAIKKMRLAIKDFRSIPEAISTAGGVAFNQLSENGELINSPAVYCCGEMVSWDAPTGGYLIQGCVSSGYVVGESIRKLLIDPR